MVRRSDSFCAKGEIGLKSGEREQESDSALYVASRYAEV
jgi:hypothetical protein